MTDATAGRGGVGIRLYTVGGDLVKRNFNDIGDSGKRMWADVATGNKAANPAIRALATGVGEAKGGIEGLASRAGPAANVLGSFGSAGLAAAAGLGGLAIALGKAQEAMHWAAELTDTSDRIGVSVEKLQAWNYVADEAGVSTAAMQANLEKLNGVLGAFKSGIGDAKLKPVFEELGITTEQLQNVQTADQLMMILADTLGQVKDRALQVKFARSFGIEESLPIMRLGSQGIRDLSDEAERLGLIMGGDVVKALDEADRKLEVAQQRINSTVRLAVAGLAGDFADLVGQIAGAVVQLARWDAQVQRLSGAAQRPSRSLPSIISDSLRGRTAEEGEAARDEGARRQPGWVTWMGVNQPRLQAMQREDDLRRKVGELASGTGEYAERKGLFDPRGHTQRSGGANSSARDAERLAGERERALQQLSQTEQRNSRDILPLRWSGGKAIDNESVAIENQRLYVEERDAQREVVRKALEKAGVLDDDVRLRLAGLGEMDAEHDLLVSLRISQTKAKELAEERLSKEQVATDDAVALLDVQSQLAKTGAERFAIGQKILLAEQALERLARETQMKADGVVTEDEQASYDAMLRRQEGDRTVSVIVEDDRLKEQFKSYGREVVGAIQDGRLGEYIGDQLKAKLLDGALNALFNMMSSGGKSEGGGFLSSALKFGASIFTHGGGRASGGDTRAAFMYGAAEHGPELFMLSGNGHVSSAAETAKMVLNMGGGGERGGAGSAAAPQIVMSPITINAPGADAAALKRVENEVRELNRTLEKRAVEAMTDYRQRSHRG